MRNLFGVFRYDLRAQFSRLIPALTFLAVAFMPILYAGFLIMGYWDPYGRLQKLPIAIVNLDQGAERNGETVLLGNDFVEQLKNDPEFNWKFVSLKEAVRGLEAGEYYAMITVRRIFPPAPFPWIRMTGGRRS